MPEVLTAIYHDEKVYYLPFTTDALERLFYALNVAYVHTPSGTEQELFIRSGLDTLRALCNP